MNREIKFRGWNVVGKKMVDLKAITAFALDATLSQDDLFLPFSEDIVLMQFTGLKDKNGIEVFEGDIIQPYVSSNHKVEICQIRYLDRAFCMAFPEDESKMDTVWYYDFEVIGNIYQNPELLEAKS